MTTRLVGTTFVRSFLILVIILPAWASADTWFDQFIIFGDSLSDSGNFFVETGEFVRAPFDVIPSAPYAIGGHHFSNGRTWIEQLAAHLHTPESAFPALRGAPGVFTNYAFGRARARAGAPTFPQFDLGFQVDLFLSDFGSAPPEALYVIWIGSNDVRDALVALATDPIGGTSVGIIQAAITATTNNLIALFSAGARTFLVLNLPDTSLTPAVRAQGPAVQAVARAFSVAYNDGLSAALDLLATLPTIEIIRLDVFSLVDAVVDSPPAGFSNVRESCLAFGVIGRAICSRPNTHLFWDGVHPTKAGHGVLAEAAAEALSLP